MSVEATIDTTNLRASLRARWNDLVSASELPLHRAATLNLIATTTPADLSELRREFQHLVTRQPCRAFFLVFDRDAQLAASYHAGVEIDTKSRYVKYERVTLTLRPEQLPRARSMIRPLVLADLPRILFTRSSIEDPSISAALGPAVDLHVFDSATLADPEQELGPLRAATPNYRDLSWLRVTPWRRALARAFEHFAWHSDEPTEVVLVRSDSPGARAAAYVVTEWLEGRLGAHVTHALPSRPDAPTCDLTALTLRHAGIAVELEHCCDRPRIRTRIELEDQCLVPFDTPASRGGRGALLAAAADGV